MSTWSVTALNLVNSAKIEERIEAESADAAKAIFLDLHNGLSIEILEIYDIQYPRPLSNGSANRNLGPAYNPEQKFGYTNAPVDSAPIKAGWILIAIAWLLFLVPVPGLGILGWVINFAAFIVAIVLLTKSKIMQGVIQLICTILISPVIYLIGLAILAAYIVN